MDYLVHRYRVSERRACKLVEQHRSTQRYAAMGAEDGGSVTLTADELGVPGEDLGPPAPPVRLVRTLDEEFGEEPGEEPGEVEAVEPPAAAGAPWEGAPGGNLVPDAAWRPPEDLEAHEGEGEPARQPASSVDGLAAPAENHERIWPGDLEGDREAEEAVDAAAPGTEVPGAGEQRVTTGADADVEEGGGLAALDTPPDRPASARAEPVETAPEPVALGPVGRRARSGGETLGPDDAYDDDEYDYDWIYESDMDFVGRRPGAPSGGGPVSLKAVAPIGGSTGSTRSEVLAHPVWTPRTEGRPGEPRTAPARGFEDVVRCAARAPVDAVRLPVQVVGGAARLAVGTSAACVASARSVAGYALKSLCASRRDRRR